MTAAFDASSQPGPGAVAADFDARFANAACESWTTYYNLIRTMHLARGRSLTHPIKDRNLVTTASEHVGVFEDFWRTELARSLGVPRLEVGSRTVRFREYRSKSFDVCWPLEGEPKILISVKSMQNAYRNLTNRVEEALGDSAVLRIYNSKAAFGFFFFVLDGPVARGRAEVGAVPSGNSAGRTKGIAPFLALVEVGGDFFDLSEINNHRRPPATKNRSAKSAVGRLDSIDVAQRSLLDLLSSHPQEDADIHYDAMALVPAKVNRVADGTDRSAWGITPSPVDARLDHRNFIDRLLEVARLRRLL